MSIHIGKIIQSLVKDKGIGVTEFSKKINYSRRNVYEIFNKKTIDTGLLIKINKILDENLFINYLSDSEIKSFKNSKTTKEEFDELILNLKNEIKKLKDFQKR